MKMNTKSKLISSLLVLVLCVTAFFGSTYAWFTDSVTSSGNRIQAGTLDVDLLMYKDGNYASIGGNNGDIFTEANGNATLWEPGKTQIVYLAVKNAGTLALKYNILLNVIDNGLVGSLEYAIVPGAVGGVDSFSNWEAVKAVAQTGMIAAGKTTAAEGGCLDEVLNGVTGETEYFALAVHMKEEAGNDYQGKDVTIDIILEASQKNAESDSFGSDYDIDSTYLVSVSTAEELEAALNMGTGAKLEDDIDLTKPIVINVPATATYSLRSTPAAQVLDLNGKTISASISKDGKALIINNGNLIIKGDENSLIKNTATNGCAVILNKGILTINGGKYQGAPSDLAAGYASYAINTDGAAAELTLNGAEVSGRGAIGVTGGAKAMVNGGKYHTPEVAWGHAIYAVGEGTEVTVNDGTFSEGYEEAADNWGMYQIYSGNNAKVVVNGGTFKEWDCANGYDLCTANGGTIVIYGGTFAENPASQNGIDYVADGYVSTQNTDGTWAVGGKKITTVEEFKEFLTSAGEAGAGNTALDLTTDVDLTGQTWTPIKVDGYHGADIVTLDGNGHTIKGLTAPLFAGGFAGGSGIIIKDLTIADSQILSTNTIGSGAFIESVDSMAQISLTNCHLKNSTVTGGAGSRTGGLLGWTAGYSNENDGPVKTYVTIEDCTVEGCTITCDGSVGGIYGHAGNNDWTYSTVKNCTVKNCTLKSTDDGGWRVGVVVGTANVGELTIENITESGNTLTQTGKTAPEGQSNLYGRFVPGTTGKLTIDGVAIN